MLYLVERRKDNIQSFLKYKGLTNSNIIKKIRFIKLDTNIAKIITVFNYNYGYLKWNVDVRNCSLNYNLYTYKYKTKKKSIYRDIPLLHIEWNWNIDNTNFYPPMSYTFVNIKLYPQKEYEKEFFPNFTVEGWYWDKYEVSVIIRKTKTNLYRVIES